MSRHCVGQRLRCDAVDFTISYSPRVGFSLEAISIVTMLAPGSVLDQIIDRPRGFLPRSLLLRTRNQVRATPPQPSHPLVPAYPYPRRQRPETITKAARRLISPSPSVPRPSLLLGPTECKYQATTSCRRPATRQFHGTQRAGFQEALGKISGVYQQVAPTGSDTVGVFARPCMWCMWWAGRSA